MTCHLGVYLFKCQRLAAKEEDGRNHIDMLDERRFGETVRGDGVAQYWFERGTRDLKDRGSNPVRSTRQICDSFFPSQKCCADSLSVRPTPPYVHARTRMIMYDR